MGAKVCNIQAYYHGNDGERGLQVSVHFPFSVSDISALKDFVKRNDVEGFARWLKKEHSLFYLCIAGRTNPCLVGTFHALKESGVLEIQTGRMVVPSEGPFFPREWVDEARVLRDRIGLTFEE